MDLQLKQLAPIVLKPQVTPKKNPCERPMNNTTINFLADNSLLSKTIVESPQLPFSNSGFSKQGRKEETSKDLSSSDSKIKQQQKQQQQQLTQPSLQNLPNISPFATFQCSINTSNSQSINQSLQSINVISQQNQLSSNHESSNSANYSSISGSASQSVKCLEKNVKEDQIKSRIGLESLGVLRKEVNSFLGLLQNYNIEILHSPKHQQLIQKKINSEGGGGRREDQLLKQEATNEENKKKFLNNFEDKKQGYTMLEEYLEGGTETDFLQEEEREKGKQLQEQLQEEQDQIEQQNKRKSLNLQETNLSIIFSESEKSSPIHKHSNSSDSETSKKSIYAFQSEQQGEKKLNYQTSEAVNCLQEATSICLKQIKAELSQSQYDSIQRKLIQLIQAYSSQVQLEEEKSQALNRKNLNLIKSNEMILHALQATKEEIKQLIRNYHLLAADHNELADTNQKLLEQDQNQNAIIKKIEKEKAHLTKLILAADEQYQTTIEKSAILSYKNTKLKGTIAQMQSEFSNINQILRDVIVNLQDTKDKEVQDMLSKILKETNQLMCSRKDSESPYSKVVISPRSPHAKIRQHSQGTQRSSISPTDKEQNCKQLQVKCTNEQIKQEKCSNKKGRDLSNQRKTKDKITNLIQMHRKTSPGSKEDQKIEETYRRLFLKQLKKPKDLRQ